MRFVFAVCFAVGMLRAEDVALPAGVKAVWSLENAYREKTTTRERICLNGLWRWQPAVAAKDDPPGEMGGTKWGFFKVPGCWPGNSDYMQKDSQTLFAHPDWKSEKLGAVSQAWYQREFNVPTEWNGRRVALSVEYLNSLATVFVDGKNAGELRFPGGEIELTDYCAPGAYVLTLRVSAVPLKGVMLSYADSATAREVKGSVERRGLCGDVFLVSTPKTARIADVAVATSFRNESITFKLELAGNLTDAELGVRAQIMDHGVEVAQFKREHFKISQADSGRITLTEHWKPAKLWDIHTPQNQYEVVVSLLDARGNVLDTALPVRFGFREFWIDGRDFYLNGSRIHLSALPIDCAAVSAGAATYPAVMETLARLKSFGINFVYTHNYGCEPGSHLAFSEMLRACDDSGMLVSFSQPHFSHYDWKAPDADANNGYAAHAEYYVRAARNHPSVVFYSMSHNATGYNGDMDPDLIDGVADPRDNWSRNNVKLALRAEAIVRKLDPSRIVYHHASGNLGPMWNSNFYPNFVPIQELSDWFEHWASTGQKPAFTCEYGAPFTWDWSNYRGWYKGQRAFGNAAVQWEFCFAEWNAQFLGDRAFKISEREKENLRYEAKQFRAGNVWHRWDYPNEIGSPNFDDRHAVIARYVTDNWRAFRTWGLSANSPWECGHYWKPRAGLDRKRVELLVDWEQLQRPGYSPDFIGERYERMDMAFEKNDWVATPSADALMRNNQPLLGYIAGKPSAFTSKDHNFVEGEEFEKQLIVINDSRAIVQRQLDWSLGIGGGSGTNSISLWPGQQERMALKLRVPKFITEPPGEFKFDTYKLTATFKFSTGETQTDAFDIHVLPARAPQKLNAKVALFDPKGVNGETSNLLESLGVEAQIVDANADLAAFDMLIVGKAALTLNAPAPNISRVRDGLKVVVFEQTSEVLEQRFGFRVVEYGLRNVFARIPDHALLTDLKSEHLRDWRGAATLLPPRLKLESNPRFNGSGTVKWCGIDVTRLWRCGNRGNVASVLIEKPARGDFLPIIDGGFSLQYSPLMEYREGRGMVLFCQMDVTGRTEDDPAARILAGNILDYAAAWKPAEARRLLYAGDVAAGKLLGRAGFALDAYAGGKIDADRILVADMGSAEVLSAHKAALAEFVNAGGRVLLLGFDESAAKALLPLKIATKNGEHIGAYFDPPGRDSLAAGIGPADVHNRDPRSFPLVTGGAAIFGDGVLAQALKSNVVLCQLAPWSLDYSKQYNLKRTFRRSSWVLTRLLCNMGAASGAPLIERFETAVDPKKEERRWLDGFYLDVPEELDDPYRFFRW